MFKLLTSLIILIFSGHNVSNSQDIQDKISEALRNYPSIEINIPDTSRLQATPTNFPRLNLEPSNTPNPGFENSTKIYSYNTSSEKPIGQVANVALKNSPVLIPCTEVPDGCEDKKTPQTPTPTSVLPSPTPSPVPSITPSEPTPLPCKYNLDTICPEIACIDNGVSSIKNWCCPCVPPPIY